LFGLTKYRKGP